METGYMFKHLAINRENNLWPLCIGFALVVTIVFLIYLPTLSFEFINWDDPDYVLNNQAIQTPGWSGIKEILTKSIPVRHGDYIPVTILSYWIDYKLWEFRPTGYHLTNLLLHAFASGLMFLLLKRLTMTTVASMMVTLLFALHPMNTEAVTWIAERKSEMGMFWMLLSFHSFLSWQRGIRTYRIYFYLSLFFYLLACLSKTAVVFFPLILMAYQVCLAKKGLRRSMIALLPFFLISVLTGIGRLFGHYASGQMDWKPFETPWVQALTIVELFGGYLKTLLIPMNLNNRYPFQTSNSLFDFGVLFGLLSLVGMIALVIRYHKKHPLVCFGLIWYLAAWLPHAQIIAIPPVLRADRYVYYSSTGLFLAIVFGMDQWVINMKQGITARRLRVVACAGVFLVIGVFAWMTACRNSVWSDSVSLWGDSAKKYDRNAEVHNNLGYSYYQKGLSEKAILEYKRALAISPDYIDVYNNLGVAYRNIGMTDEAISVYKKVLAINPNLLKPRFNLGNAYRKKGELDKAISEYKKALDIKPDYAEVHNNLSVTYHSKGNYMLAIMYCDKAVGLGYRVHPKFLELLKPYR